MDAGFSHMVDGALKAWRKRGAKGIPPVILGQFMALDLLLIGVLIVMSLKRFGLLSSAEELLPSVPNGFFFAATALIVPIGIWAFVKMFKACKRN